MKSPVKQLEPNFKGKDYVIGDLHGCYDIFQNLLRNIHFDLTVDRIISVGDLIDRGPDSLKCLSLLKEPWFHSVLSNHEQMMLERSDNDPLGYFWFKNGGDWGREAINDLEMFLSKGIIPREDSSMLFSLIPLVEKLPYLITVNTKSGKKFHVLHAEMPTERITDDDLTDPEKVVRLATVFRGDGDVFLWGRHLFGPFYDNNFSNRDKAIRIAAYGESMIFNDKLSHIISGHTILQRPMTIMRQTCIDTGASFCYDTKQHKWAALTCIELDSWAFYQVTPTTFKKVEPFIVTEDDMINRKIT